MLLYLISLLTAAVLLGADQWTKFWVENHMALEEIRPLLPPVLELHAVHNYGAAWSIFSGARWVLVGVTGAMMLAVAAALIMRVVRHPVGVFSAFLILAGGIGNLLDRIVQGYVVDMLRFPFWTSYPTFNVADICVVTGCILWLLYVLFVREELGDGMAKTAGEAPAGEVPGGETPAGETKNQDGGAGESGDAGKSESGDAEEAPGQEGIAADASAEDGTGAFEEETQDTQAQEEPEEAAESAAVTAPVIPGIPAEGTVTAVPAVSVTPGWAKRKEIDPSILGGSPWKDMDDEDEDPEDADCAANLFGGTPFRKTERHSGNDNSRDNQTERD